MTVFRHQTTIPHPRSDVFAWHERPGALIRLCPPWNSSVAAPSTDGVQVGSTASLRLDVPGTFGTFGVHWVAEHVALDPGRSFTDVMASGPLRSWRHHHEFTDAPGGGTTITDTIEFSGPVPGLDAAQGSVIRRILEENFAYRERQLVGDLAFHAAHDGPRRVIAVAGASGMIGTQLCALLRTGGHEVRRLVRRPARADDEITWDPASGVIDEERLVDADVIVHLGGHTIGGRFTEANKRAMRTSRIDSTTLLADTVTRLAARRGAPPAFVCGSAVGIYGADRGDEVLHETSRAGEDFLASLCVDWERATEPAATAGARVVNVRTGIVQSPAGGALARQLPLFRVGLGGRLGSGEQWVSWIGIDDIVGIIAHAALSNDVSGPLNGVAPDPVTGSSYARILGSVLGRPALVPVPNFAPAILLGREGAEEVAFASQRVAADAVAGSGYRFRHTGLAAALAHNLGR